MSCLACTHCHPEIPRTSADLVHLGRVTPPFMPPISVQDAWRAAPPETFDELMAWVRLQAGTRGRRTVSITIVTDDGEWTETHVPQPAKVFRRRRRR